MSDKLVKALRDHLGAPSSLSDEKILEVTSGTLFRSGLEFEMAFNDLCENAGITRFVRALDLCIKDAKIRMTRKGRR